MSLRKSTRARTLTSKVKEANKHSTNKELGLHETEPQQKKRRLATASKIEEEKSDKLDPVERLLNLTNMNSDFLLNLEEENEFESNISTPSNASYGPATNQISLNFTQILNDNLRTYYSNFGKSRIEIYNDNSSFSVLNKKKVPFQQSTTQEPSKSTASEVPFFRNVNFDPKPQTAYTFDEYLSYDELTSDNDSEESSDEKSSNPKSPITALPEINNSKMSFHYRRNDNLNLSMNHNDNDEQQDIFKIMNKRSILTGKASEMVSTGNFLINDFFL